MQIITSLFYHKIFVTIVLINSAGDSQPFFFFSKAKMDKTVATSNKLREANAAFRKTYDKNKKIITL